MNAKMKGAIGSKLLSLVVVMVLCLASIPLALFTPNIAYAAEGTSGTCSWSVVDGKLTIEPTDGVSGTIKDWDQAVPPWLNVVSSITSVEIKPGVKAGTCTRLFYDCKNLTSIKGLENLDTSEVTNFEMMFSGCSQLTSIDLSKFNTSNAIAIWQMFGSCSSLTTLDLSSFCTSNVTSMEQMFVGCSSLTTIYVSDLWDTNNVTSSNNMFSGCGSLVGGNGTRLSFSRYDKEYARIDAADTPGYLTYKATPAVAAPVSFMIHFKATGIQATGFADYKEAFAALNGN